MNTQNATEIMDNYISGRELEEYLCEIFGGPIITSLEFKRFMRMSDYQIKWMKECKAGPNLIYVGGGEGEGRYLVADIARWLDKRLDKSLIQNMIRSKVKADGQKRGRGRPKRIVIENGGMEPQTLPAA